LHASQAALQKAGVTVLGLGERGVRELGLQRAPSERHEYGCNALTLELVSDMDEAIEHIHAHGSGHTEAIVTGAQRLCALHAALDAAPHPPIHVAGCGLLQAPSGCALRPTGGPA
jgi:gamma-glutamyl phosphate reductase